MNIYPWYNSVISDEKKKEFDRKYPNCTKEDIIEMARFGSYDLFRLVCNRVSSYGYKEPKIKYSNQKEIENACNARVNYILEKKRFQTF